jgi:hypothetical protein
LQFISELCQDILEIPREKVCVNLLDDYFVPNLDFSLLQNEGQPRLRYVALKFLILPIPRQMTLECPPAGHSFGCVFILLFLCSDYF